MSNIVKFSINGDTNAEQVVGRAKGAMSGLEKQLDGIGKKFGTGFKDIFLSFLGPMALLGTAMSFIGKMIADNQKKQEDATKAAIDGTNALMSAEDKYYANKRNNEKKAIQTTEEAAVARSEVTKDFLENDPRGQKIFDNAFTEKTFGQPFRKTTPGLISDDPAIQAKVQALIAEDMKKNPAATGPSGTPFKSPDGFGNVIGVGANPVLEAMTSQLNEAKRTNDLLAAIASGTGARTTSWLNASESPAPSRASLLKSK
jgi:hypothetical protein